MTNRLELTWKVDGFFEEQRYYCATSPIDINSLPVPKAVLTNDLRTYIDQDIIEGQTYYVRIGSVKNGVLKISDEKMLKAGGDEHWGNVISLLHFNGEFTDQAETVWTVNGSPSFITDTDFFGQSAQFSTEAEHVSTGADIFFDFNNSFTAEFYAKIMARPSSTQISSILNIGIPNTITLYSGFGVNYAGYPFFYEYNNNSALTLTGSSIIPLNTKTHFALCFDKVTNTLRIFINGAVVASRAMPVPIRPTGQQFSIGSGYFNYLTNFLIDEFRYTKEVARYKSNFIPQPAEFPDF